MYFFCPTRAKICANPGKDCFYSRKKSDFHFNAYEFKSIAPSNTTVLVLPSWPVKIQSLEVLKKHIYYCVSLWRYNIFWSSAPIVLCKWVRKRHCAYTSFLPLSSYHNILYNGNQDNSVIEWLIFKNILLGRHILFGLLACQDPNFLTYVSGRTYTLCLLSLCRATSCLLFFFLNSLALWYQHLVTT